jgi:hypothetical protein
MPSIRITSDETIEALAFVMSNLEADPQGFVPKQALYGRYALGGLDAILRPCPSPIDYSDESDDSDLFADDPDPVSIMSQRTFFSVLPGVLQNEFPESYPTRARVDGKAGPWGYRGVRLKSAKPAADSEIRINGSERDLDWNDDPAATAAAQAAAQARDSDPYDGY